MSFERKDQERIDKSNSRYAQRNRMKPEISFVRHFEAILLDRSDWLEGWPNCLEKDALLSFTDGSKASSGTGA